MMTTNINQLSVKLKEAAAQVARVETLTERRKSLQEERARLIADLTHAEEALQKAQRMSSRLAGFSPHRLFYRLIGKLEETMKQTEAGLREARNKVEGLQHSLRQVEADLLHAERQLDSLYNARPTFNALLEQKARLIHETNRPEREQLQQIESRMVNIEKLLDEITQAIEAGNRARTALHKLDDILDSASAWGGLDIIGGGTLVSMLKHSRLNEAREAGRYAAATLEQFRKELMDAVNIQQNLLSGAHIGTIDQLGDILFDGILPDLWVQNKIETWQQQVRSLLTNLETTLRKLTAKRDELHLSRQNLDSQRKEIIVTAK